MRAIRKNGVKKISPQLYFKIIFKRNKRSPICTCMLFFEARKLNVETILAFVQVTNSNYSSIFVPLQQNNPFPFSLFSNLDFPSSLTSEYRVRLNA